MSNRANSKAKCSRFPGSTILLGSTAAIMVCFQFWSDNTLNTPESDTTLKSRISIPFWVSRSMYNRHNRAKVERWSTKRQGENMGFAVRLTHVQMLTLALTSFVIMKRDMTSQSSSFSSEIQR